jgi:hypothetical protein
LTDKRTYWASGVSEARNRTHCFFHSFLTVGGSELPQMPIGKTCGKRLVALVLSLYAQAGYCYNEFGRLALIPFQALGFEPPSPTPDCACRSDFINSQRIVRDEWSWQAQPRRDLAARDANSGIAEPAWSSNGRKDRQSADYSKRRGHS